MIPNFVWQIATAVAGVTWAIGWLRGILAWARRGFGVPRTVHVAAVAVAGAGLLVALGALLCGAQAGGLALLSLSVFPVWVYVVWMLLGCPCREPPADGKPATRSETSDRRNAERATEGDPRMGTERQGQTDSNRRGCPWPDIRATESPTRKAPPSTVDYSPEAVLARIRANAHGEPAAPLHIPGWVALAFLAASVIAIAFWYRGIGRDKVPLGVVNTGSEAPLEIRLDGKPIGRAPRMIGEDPRAAVMATLRPGKHAVEARDSRGAVVARETFAVDSGTHGFLWAPLPDRAARFFIQTTSYGQGVPEYTTELDRDRPLKTLPAYVSYWFRTTPAAVSVPKGWQSTRANALRRAAAP